ncbi:MULTISPECIES: 16S rRNA (guanine(527)-N(7))-methyltransferase RsmG [unclassified Paraflavitalea]|uniref:16S rRNA (guanine(527)-N(7))-methyltransferase RsmG n=1 Tax=unclassified Paraflavitalea TaxID=2798305 RepID=UPI003D351390
METPEQSLDIITQYFSDFSEVQLEQLRQLAPLYKEWNEKINVISRKDIESLYEKHVLHSLSIAAVFDFEPNMKVLDLGTGGGFPGIPLAIFFPQTRFHLVDSIGKKLKVVEGVAEAIGLKNITTKHSRVEALAGQKFDVVISRAVAPLKDLWTWSKPLLRKSTPSEGDLPKASGLICLKGGDLAQEIFESGCKPKVMEITHLFKEPFFQEKFIIQVPH